jgi:enoyl-CoA hydratase/carnithine racemase
MSRPNTDPSTEEEPVIIELDSAEGSVGDLAAIEHRPNVSIGVVTGRCEGFGLAMAMAVDLVVAAPGATFGRPGPWASVLVRRGPGIMGRRAVGYLVMTDRVIEAETALHWGLVSHLADDPSREAAEILAGVATRSAIAVRTILRQAHRGAAAHYAELGAVAARRSEEGVASPGQ